MNQVKIEKNLKKLIFFSNLISYSLSLIVLILYFSFILILGFAPQLFHKFLNGTSITYGIFAGLSIIIISILLTLIYVIISNHFLDNLKNNDD
tara:strand:+ start:6510 stop:6788 length:279 start_codon:yes stop_codon:yes gene_type:complete